MNHAGLSSTACSTKPCECSWPLCLSSGNQDFFVQMFIPVPALVFCLQSMCFKKEIEVLKISKRTVKNRMLFSFCVHIFYAYVEFISCR
jgi:hypothetical protein